MSVTKELVEHERQLVQIVQIRDVHLHKEGTFLRAYDWNAWLCCRLLHDFKVNKRLFKGIDEPVVYIGFPETSLHKWLPEGVQQEVAGDKHLIVHLPEIMLTETLEVMQSAYRRILETTTQICKQCYSQTVNDQDSSTRHKPRPRTPTEYYQLIFWLTIALSVVWSAIPPFCKLAWCL